MTMKRLKRWRYIDGELVCVGELIVPESWKSEHLDTQDNGRVCATSAADNASGRRSCPAALMGASE